jgi:parallel beta-helix repeat protein
MRSRDHHQTTNKGIILLLLLFPLLVQSSSGKDKSFAWISAADVVQPPINIAGNLDFQIQASQGNWRGDGTATSPFVIEGLNITSSSNTDLIHIENTDVYFRIENCWLKGGYNGIYLDDVINGQISDNIIINNEWVGINLLNAENNTLANNQISNNGGPGTHLLNAGNNAISSNLISNNGGPGIRLDFSTAWLGDYLGSRSCTIIGNTISKNVGGGIHLLFVVNATISGNIVSENDRTGISGGFTDNSTISGNDISYNSGYGIYLDNAENNTFRGNDFTENNPTGPSQAYDDGPNNTFIENYWSEWTLPDGNQDGVVDRPYEIDGPTNNRDTVPLVSPVVPQTDLFLEHLIPTAGLLVVILGTLGISILVQRRRRVQKDWYLKDRYEESK